MKHFSDEGGNPSPKYDEGLATHWVNELKEYGLVDDNE
jgi:hypothetical protein